MEKLTARLGVTGVCNTQLLIQEPKQNVQASYTGPRECVTLGEARLLVSCTCPLRRQRRCGFLWAVLPFATPAAETASCVVRCLELDVVSPAPGVRLVLETASPLQADELVFLRTELPAVWVIETVWPPGEGL